MKPSLPRTSPAGRLVPGFGFCPFGARNGLGTDFPGHCPGLMNRRAFGAPDGPPQRGENSPAQGNALGTQTTRTFLSPERA